MEYPFDKIEKKWQERWKNDNIFHAKDDSKKKYYVLSMFPYPSGALHMGHVSNYSIGDAITRFKMQEGFDVMQPMGYDAFGMPAENFAIKHNSHPSITTFENMDIMQNQFEKMGFGFDWDRKLATCDPKYYKWGQWLFKKFYEQGLVYKKKSYVNWCDDCNTVLANEQVEDGSCWRCHSEVRQKELEQWFFKITEYAEELLDFSKVIDWPERVKAMQTNWIGKSNGTEVDFKFEDKKIPVFTTRPDTIFGVTFMALAPEHEIIQNMLKEENIDPKLEKFCHKVINEDKDLRTSDKTEKEGIFTGKYCINPVNGEKVQIWVTNYVVTDYGTGAVMAVPAHDQRDFDFAKKYEIPMKLVIQNEDENLILEKMEEAYIEPGEMVNSKDFTGKNSKKTIPEISKWIEDNNFGKITINYRLRDWGISRQRYWGNPIPIVHCDKCGEVLVPDEELPIELPKNVELGKTTENPLLSVEDWVNTKCPKCGEAAKRETDTMDTFVDSSWYFARYTDSKNENQPFNPEIANQWLPVDQYIGGIEHATMHLMYARFFHKVLRDLKFVKSDEPFARLLTQGMVNKDGSKMSKSKGNVVDPVNYINRYGADTIRVFMLFASPPEKDVEWSDKGVKGAFRFLNRLWRIVENNLDLIKENNKEYSPKSKISKQIKDLRFSTHVTLKKILEDINNLQFNTAIAATMEHLNNLYKIENPDSLNSDEKRVFAEACIVPIKMIYPFAPHITEELWEMLGNEDYIHTSGVPNYVDQYTKKDEITYVVQIMGKVRGKFQISSEADKKEIEKTALEQENVQKHLEGKDIKKIIVVPKKLVSIVAK